MLRSYHHPVGDQMNMAVLFWYLVKSDWSSVRYCTGEHWTSHFLQGPRNTRQCITGHPVSGRCILNWNIRDQVYSRDRIYTDWRYSLWKFSLLSLAVTNIDTETIDRKIYINLFNIFYTIFQSFTVGNSLARIDCLD